MSDYERVETAVVVLEGQINPAIITVDWLVSQNLVSRGAMRKADIRFMDPDLSRFDVAHFRVEVRRDRITIASSGDLESFHPVGDFASGIFEVLRHTPVTALSMSKAIHLTLPPENGWDKLKEKATGVALTQLLVEPDLRRLTLTGLRDDNRPGAIEVTIERDTEPGYGVYIVATERMTFGDPGPAGRGAIEALAAIEGRWDVWLSRADEIVASIAALATDDEGSKRDAAAD